MGNVKKFMQVNLFSHLIGGLNNESRVGRGENVGEGYISSAPLAAEKHHVIGDHRRRVTQPGGSNEPVMQPCGQHRMPHLGPPWHCNVCSATVTRGTARATFHSFFTKNC